MDATPTPPHEPGEERDAELRRAQARITQLEAQLVDERAALARERATRASRSRAAGMLDAAMIDLNRSLKVLDQARREIVL